MGQIIQNNILFNNVKQPSIPLSTGPLSIGNQTGPSRFGGIINAVDIDWNEATLSDNSTINTTGQLIEKIDNTYSKSDIDNKLDAINYNINNIDQKLTNHIQTFNEAIEALIERITDLESKINQV